MLTLKRTIARNPDFIALVKKLDAYLAIQDGDEHDFYDQFNKLNAIKFVIVAYEGAVPVGCGAIKQFNDNTMEIKRMYVSPERRGKGIARRILAELEKWALELGAKRCILETGVRQPEAIALYENTGYSYIANYAPYTHQANSRCFEKKLGNPTVNSSHDS